ncbi:MAG: PIN domain-containing protein [Micromonosporaceae bacterium]|nr:PIN domain-containing protein [Micromonosporaceae bacterium]
MTVLVDTSALIAFYDRRSADHDVVVQAFRDTPAPLSVSPLVLAEFDFLIGKYAGEKVALAAAREIAGTMQIEDFPASDLRAAADVMEQYADLKLGMTDASIVVIAQRCRTERILTLDHRHFTVVRPLSTAKAFTVLPEWSTGGR